MIIKDYCRNMIICSKEKEEEPELLKDKLSLFRKKLWWFKEKRISLHHLIFYKN